MWGVLRKDGEGHVEASKTVLRVSGSYRAEKVSNGEQREIKIERKIKKKERKKERPKTEDRRPKTEERRLKTED